MIRKVAILTKSSKNGGYCVAGIDIENGNWIRLVSDDMITHGALQRNHIQFEDGSFCTPLDVVEVPVICGKPLEYQPENVLIDSEKQWKKLGTISLEEILRIHPVEYPDCILGNLYAYLTKQGIRNVGYSLTMVEVRDLIITHPKERSTKASFKYMVLVNNRIDNASNRNETVISDILHTVPMALGTNCA